MRATPPLLAAALLALAACGGATAGPTATRAAAPAATVPAATVPAATVPAATLPAATVPAATVPAATVPAATLPATTLVTPPSAPPPGAAPCRGAVVPAGGYRHVVWIWMENHDWSQVLGSPSAAPYAAALARGCGTATHVATVGSPSLPNYVGATSGATQGIGDDADPSSHHVLADNIFRQVRAAGGTERSYEEAMSAPCQLTSSGRYAVKHNPAAYYAGGDDRQACQADDVALTAFAGDLAAGRLPTFAFVTPDLCHDTHDCGVATGDAWLASWLPALLASDAYRSGSTAVFVWWDEYTPVPDLLVAPAVAPGTVVTTAASHFSLLRTSEEVLGLPLLAGAATAPSLRRPLGS